MDGKIIKAPGFCSKIALLSTIPRLPTNITVSDFAATISYYFSMSRLSMSKYSYSLTLKQLRAPPALPHPCQLVSFGTHSPLSWPCPPRLPLTLLSQPHCALTLPGVLLAPPSVGRTLHALRMLGISLQRQVPQLCLLHLRV